MKEINLFNSEIKVQLEHLKRNEIWGAILKRNNLGESSFYYELIANPQFSFQDIENLIIFLQNFINEEKAKYPDWYKKNISFDENLVGKKIVSKLNLKKETHEVLNFFAYNNVKFITIALFQVEEGTPNERTMFGIISEKEFYQDFEVID